MNKVQLYYLNILHKNNANTVVLVAKRMLGLLSVRHPRNETQFNYSR